MRVRDLGAFWVVPVFTHQGCAPVEAGCFVIKPASVTAPTIAFEATEWTSHEPHESHESDKKYLK